MSPPEGGRTSGRTATESAQLVVRHCGRRTHALSERDGEMARKTSGKRGAAIIALIAALAALAGPGAASASPGKAKGHAAAAVSGAGALASWAEEASWAEG